VPPGTPLLPAPHLLNFKKKEKEKEKEEGTSVWEVHSSKKSALYKWRIKK
jgi:hypothetical protein